MRRRGAFTRLPVLLQGNRLFLADPLAAEADRITANYGGPTLER